MTGQDHDADVIVIGSGFGGAVAAARLAQAGYSVIILERGRRWNPGDFPRDPRLRDGWLWGVDRGLYDLRWLVGMIAVQASGWGGGSLAYANVFSRPFDDRLSGKWPAHLRRPRLDPYYDLAAHMLEVQPATDDPRTGRPPERTALIEQMMGGSDRPEATIRPNLAITFGDPQRWRPNRHGVPRRGCAFVGECVIGCNHGAKNSLDATYLAVAERQGARGVTGAEAVAVQEEATGYSVVTTDPSEPDAPRRTWRARRVIVAAGAVGTTELLLRSRAAGGGLPRLSSRLGEGFSGNGDFLALAELPRGSGDMTTGPTITTSTAVDVPEGRGSVWYQVQDGAFPVVLHELFDAVVPGQTARSWWRRHTAQPDVRRVFAVLAMGHDSGAGKLRLNRFGNVVLGWRNGWQAALYRSQRRLGPMLSRLLRARLYHPITWSTLRRTTTVHPIGGVPAGPERTSGVVDECGEVHGHPGLYVMDGSTLPASTGVNPSATILAAAEQAVEELIRRDGRPDWRAPEWDAVTRTPAPEDASFAFAAELRQSTRGGGIGFSERMRTADSAPTPVALRLAVSARSIDRLFADPLHELSVEGEITLGDSVNGAPTSGTLSLFPADDAVAMRYVLRFRGGDGRRWTLVGTKTITGVTPWRVVRDLTSLSVVMFADDESSHDVRTHLRIRLSDLVGILRTMRGTGFTRARRTGTAARFAAFFARETWRRTVDGGRARRGQTA